MSWDAVSYDLLRGLHILAVIAWMAGLLMLPRLYAYQTGSPVGSELDVKMSQAAARLKRIIMTPAMLLTWALGLAMMVKGGLLQFGWFHGKLVLVLALTGLYGYFVAEGRRLAKGERRRSEKFWRLINEVPFVMAIAVVLLATLEPMF